MAKKTKKQIEDELPKCEVCGKIVLICKCEKNELSK